MEPNQKKSRNVKYIIAIVFFAALILLIIAMLKTKSNKNDSIDQTALILKYSKVPSVNVPHIPLRIIKNKKFGLTRVITCLLKDTNWVLIKNECNNLLSSEKFGFVYGYDDSLKVINISKVNNALNALPEDGKDYIFEFKKLPDEGVSFLKHINNLKK